MGSATWIDRAKTSLVAAFANGEKRRDLVGSVQRPS
jgi:hypothetical protein